MAHPGVRVTGDGIFHHTELTPPIQPPRVGRNTGHPFGQGAGSTSPIQHPRVGRTAGASAQHSAHTHTPHNHKDAHVCERTQTHATPLADYLVASFPETTLPVANIPVGDSPAANFPVANFPVAIIPVANIPARISRSLSSRWLIRGGYYPGG